MIWMKNFKKIEGEDFSNQNSHEIRKLCYQNANEQCKRNSYSVPEINILWCIDKFYFQHNYSASFYDFSGLVVTQTKWIILTCGPRYCLKVFSLYQKSLYNAWLTTARLRNSVKSKRNELQLLRQNLKTHSILKGQVRLKYFYLSFFCIKLLVVCFLFTSWRLFLHGFVILVLLIV